MPQQPSRDDPVVASLSEVVGGPVGDHARSHPWWNATRVLLLLTAVVFALGILQKEPCSSIPEAPHWVKVRALNDGDSVEEAVAEWYGDYPYSHMCYTDLRPLYVPRGMAEQAWPYSDAAVSRDRYEVMEYPVGISYWAWGTSWITHWLVGSPDREARSEVPVEDLHSLDGMDREIVVFVLVNGVGFAALALLSVWLLSRTTRGRPWDAAAFALSPTLLLTGMINWDLIAVALVAAALWAWSRDRPVLTGVLIGLGTAAKLYPLFLLGALLIICLRRRRYADFALAVLMAAATWLLANLPAMLTGFEQWQHFWTFNADRPVDLGSLWLAIDQAGDLGISPHTANVWSWILFGGWCVGVFALGMVAGRRTDAVPSFAQLGFLIVVGFLIVNKVYSPQYVLWLLPLAVLARPRWRDQLIWQSGEVFYFCAVWWYLGDFLFPSGSHDAGLYWVAIGARVVCQLYLAAMIVRDMLRPSPDEEDQSVMTTRSTSVAV